MTCGSSSGGALRGEADKQIGYAQAAHFVH